jgi:hypothetical protein
MLGGRLNLPMPGLTEAEWDRQTGHVRSCLDVWEAARKLLGVESNVSVAAD